MHRYRARVTTADLDAAGIVWYGNFLRFVEAAEDDLLRAGGVARHRIREEHNLVLTRCRFSCTFRSPARPDDELDIALMVTESTDTHVDCDFDIRHVPSERLIAHGSFRSVCLDPSSSSPKQLPPSVRAAYAAASVPESRSR